jgi:hypothetical protein
MENKLDFVAVSYKNRPCIRNPLAAKRAARPMKPLSPELLNAYSNALGPLSAATAEQRRQPFPSIPRAYHGSRQMRASSASSQSAPLSASVT